MPTFQVKVKKNSIEKKNSGSTITEKDSFPYRDVQIFFQWKKRNSSKDFSTSLKVIVPDYYQTLRLTFKIFVQRKDNPTGITLKHKSFNYDSGKKSSSGSSRYMLQGAGGFGLDTKDITTDQLLKECTQDDGFVIFHVRILGFSPQYDQDQMLQHLWTVMSSQRNGEPIESEVLRQRVDELFVESNQAEQGLIVALDEVRGEKARLDSLNEAIIVSQKENEELEAENKRFTEQIVGMKENLQKLEKQVAACTLNKALLSFNPDIVAVHDFDISSLKNLLSNILALQIRLSEEILKHNEDRCGFCGKVAPCENIPCEHILICKACFRQKPECPVCSDRVESVENQDWTLVSRKGSKKRGGNKPQTVAIKKLVPDSSTMRSEVQSEIELLQREGNSQVTQKASLEVK